MSDRPGASDYLAAERTFLAWIRTGLALMGFGFVVARFGLFLGVLLGNRGEAASSGLSVWFGAVLIAAGVVVNIASAWHHVHLVGNLQRGEFPARPSALAVAIAVLLALLGIGMGAYLLSAGNPGSAGKPAAQEKTMTSNARTQNGIVTVESAHSVDQTVEKLEAMLHGRGIKLFATIDHSGEARNAGMEMRPTKLLIFGNPKAGTPLMLAAPSIAIDLPLKLLVWEDADGRARITYNDPAYLAERHGLPAEMTKVLAAAGALAAEAAK